MGTANSDTGVVVFNEPVIKNAIPALNTLLSSNGIRQAKMDLYVGEENFGQIGYTDGIFVVRSDLKNMIRSSVSTAITLKNISAVSNLQALQTFDVTGFSSWAPAAPSSRSRHIPLTNFKFESVPFAAMAGLGQGLAGMGSMLFAQNQQQAQFRQQRALQAANNTALAERQRLMFERNLQLAGINSTSARAGIYSNVASTARQFGDHESGALPSTVVPPTQNLSVDNYQSPLTYQGPLNQGLGIDPKFNRMLYGKGSTGAPSDIKATSKVENSAALITTESVPDPVTKTTGKVPSLPTILENPAFTKPTPVMPIAATPSLPTISEGAEAFDESNYEETPDNIPSMTITRSDLQPLKG